ncbi:MAG TPA: c-type cytochrome [Gemmatimonadales bacterium]
MKYLPYAGTCLWTLLALSCGRGEPAKGGQAPGTTTPPTAAPAAAPPAAPPPAAPSAPAAAPASGTQDTTAAPAPLRDAYHTAPLDTVDGKTYQGWKYYNLNCARCHGEDALGTTIAPHLILSLKPDGTIPNQAMFVATVCGGRPQKGMPAWCTIGLTPAQIDTIYSYVKGRSDAKIHPGRPARRGQ